MTFLLFWASHLFFSICVHFADILGLEPPRNDGEYGSLHHILQNPPPLPPTNKLNDSVSLACPYPGTDQEYMARVAADTSMCVCDDNVSVRKYLISLVIPFFSYFFLPIIGRPSSLQTYLHHFFPSFILFLSRKKMYQYTF